MKIGPLEIHDDTLNDFAAKVGAKEVHRAWRDKMLEQGRQVAPERMDWNALPDKDKQLDEVIAYNVAFVFLLYLEDKGQP